MTYRTICNGENCCQVGIDDNGIESILSCTSHWPNSRMSP